MDLQWRVEVLGRLRARSGDRILTRFRTQKGALLLGYLAYHLQRPHARDELVEMLWPESEPAAGRNNLSSELSMLRRDLEPPGVTRGAVLMAGRAIVQLNPETVTTDRSAFESALHSAACAEEPGARASHLAAAIDAYSGELLPGHTADWLLSERAWLSERYFQGLAQLLDHLERTGEIPRAVEYARRAIRIDPLREEAHRHLMRLLAVSGEPGAALRQYRELEGLLKRELDAEPASETQALAGRLSALAVTRPAPSVPSAAPAGPVTRDAAGGSPAGAESTPGALSRPLPTPRTPLLGREREVAGVQALLRRADVALVTLTGVGGSGKTRLALHLAAQLTGDFPDGVFFVDLAPISDPDLVISAVAEALDAHPADGQPLLECLIDRLQEKRLLIVLDNCEQVVAAAAQIGRLLAAAPRVKALATSRERLRLHGEQEFPVPLLPVPDPGKLPPLTELLRYTSVQLFVQRAQGVQPAFALTGANAPLVAEICHQLDGLPLAIELAAVRVKALPLEAIRERLDDRFRLLTSGPRHDLPRHQTLRAALDWSYQLLSPPERALLRRLSVFAGGWGLEAAEAVCSDVGGEGRGVRDEVGSFDVLAPHPSPLAPGEVLDLLVQLVEKSLVIYEGGRYRMLETVRQYGRDRLEEAGEGAGVRRRHLEFFLRLAEASDPNAAGTDQVGSLERLEREHDNLRAAMEWGAAVGAIEAALRLGAVLGWFWRVRGHWEEGWRRLSGLLALEGAGARTAARARALNAAGVLGQMQAEPGTACRLFEESVSIFQELNDPRGRAFALLNLGRAVTLEGDPERARQLFEESRAIFRAQNDGRGLASVLTYLAFEAGRRGDAVSERAHWEESLAISREVAEENTIAWAQFHLGRLALDRGDLALADSHYRESLSVYHRLGDKLGIAIASERLGTLRRLQGDLTAARALYERSVAVHRELGHRFRISLALVGLGEIALRHGDLAEADRLFRQSLHMVRERGRPWGAHLISECLSGLARVDAARGQAARAARLFAAASTSREAMGAPVLPVEEAHMERDVAAARAALGEAAFAAAWAEGQAMTLDEVLRVALDDA